MRNPHSRFSYFLIIGLFFLSGVISWRLYFKVYLEKDDVDIHSFPNRIGDWIAKEIPIKEEDYEMLETRNAFTRSYTNSKGQTVYLFVIYSRDNRKVSHPPEICYTGIGATILSRKPSQVMLQNGQTLNATKLLLEKNYVHHVAYYWYMVGGTFTPHYLIQQLLFSFQNLIGRPTSSALIRVSMAVNLEQDEWGFKSAQVVQEFIKIIFPSLKSLLNS